MYHLTTFGLQSLDFAKRTLKRALPHQVTELASSPSSSFGKAVDLRDLRCSATANEAIVAASVATEGVFDSGVADSLSYSDEIDPTDVFPIISGVLNKWTNYIHGWQPRYFVLRGGTLAYYRSEEDIAFGCRGAVSIPKVSVQAHEFDECRIDVSVNDCIWYLRTNDALERQKWLEALEMYKEESGYGSQTDLHRQGSLVSLTSNKSLASSSSFRNGRNLKEKLAEIETYRDIVLRQIERLQSFFDIFAYGSMPTPYLFHRVQTDKVVHDAEDFDDVDHVYGRGRLRPFLSCPFATGGGCVSPSFGGGGSGTSQEGAVVNRGDPEELPAADPAMLSSPLAFEQWIDFKGEAITFRETTAGIIQLLQHCIEMVQQHDELWKKKLERETEKRKRYEESYRHLAAEVYKLQNQKSVVVYGGPDYEEGPHSALNEEEWHDAVDAALEKEDLENRRVERLLSCARLPTMLKSFDKIVLSFDHPLYAEIDRITREQVRYAKLGVNEGVWQLFSEDGEMKMYRRELEIDGLVCDPLKAVHTVKGVTALEFLHYFFEPEYKLDWDTTLEDVHVVDAICDDTMIIHQLHKRIWPASQRESLFWSHIRRMDKVADPEAHDLYVVCNHDTVTPKVPVNSKTIRVGLTIAMVCQTFFTEKLIDGFPRNRDCLVCKITYVSQVNPGGWAPSSALRAVYKREYPKFLKRFTNYVLQKVDKTPIRLN